MIHIVHASIAGRTRFKVAGLYRSVALKQKFESELVNVDGTKKVSASQLTGNLLILHAPELQPDDIAQILESLLLLWNEQSVPRVKASGDDHAAPDDTTATDESPTLKLKQWPAHLKRLLSRLEKKPASAWYRMKTSGVVDAMATDPKSGLTAFEAQERQARFGGNRLPDAKTRSEFELFMDQINSLPSYLLAAAAGVALLTGGLADALVIIGVVAANACIGYQTESEAEKTIESLKDMVRPTAAVLRGGKIREESVENVVPGDLLVLKPGSYVAADCRLVNSADLSIDESMLTGESLPVFKRTGTLRKKDIPLGDRFNMAYMGTQVTGGQGHAVAVATGCYTEIGKLQRMLQDTERPETPMERQLRVLGDQLVLLCGVICGSVFLLGFLRGYGLTKMLRSAISLAAAAVPEGLPAAATINFALGIRNMRNHGILIRRMQAVEALGAIQTICLDKTGTLTQNRMAVQQVFSGGKIYRAGRKGITLEGLRVVPHAIGEIENLIRVCVLCSETKVKGNGQNRSLKLRGSSTENALVHLAVVAGIDPADVRKQHPLLDLNHRAENRHFMATYHTLGRSRVLEAVKGSPPEVLGLCTRQMKNGRITKLTENDRREIEMQNEQMAGQALRVLGLACSKQNGDGNRATNGDLVWLGLVGMADPIREGVRDLMGNFHQAGIDTVMITGDQNATAHAVAREVNIAGNQQLEILDSVDLTTVNHMKLKALAQKAHAYSRVSPADKLKIVQALKAAGRTVAMTGDGINDGPALKAADLGIAMGRSGTDVAREVADVVLEDDNLETLILAVRDGRGIYTNIRKSVKFFLATNLSEIMVMFTAMAAGVGFPLNVMQLMWINIISDIYPALALSLDPPADDVLEQQPRDGAAPLFAGTDFKRMFFESSVISAMALAAYTFGLTRYGQGNRASTLAFHSLTIGQLLHALSCRSEGRPFWRDTDRPRNGHLKAAIGGSLAAQLLAHIVPPFRRILGTTALSLTDMAVVGGCATLPLLINETTKQRELIQK